MSSEPGAGAEGNGDGATTDDTAAKGIEALQRAAQEAIAAARAMLDVADELVRDPNAAGAVLGALTSVARAAARMSPGRHDERGDEDDDDGDGGVQRIPVS